MVRPACTAPQDHTCNCSFRGTAWALLTSVPDLTVPFCPASSAALPNPPLHLPACPAGPRDCIGQNLALMEARAVLAVLVGRFHLHCPSSREEVRASEVMKLTLQCAGGMNLTLKLRE